MGAGDKTEPATAKRRKDERKKGNVFSSREIGILAGLLLVVYVIRAMGGVTIETILQSFVRFWEYAANLTSIGFYDIRAIYIQSFGMFLLACIVPLLTAILVAFLVTMAQTRGLVSFESIKPKFSKMNPINGIKKIFSLKGIMELLKSILKIVILSYVCYIQYIERFQDLPRLMDMDFTVVLSYTGEFIMSIVNSVAVIFAALCVMDFMYQRWQFEKDMRMSKQEIKEEYKQSEGDPKVKGKIKQKQQEMSMARMMQAVPNADVVVRNPTHYAVALVYDTERGRAPVVLAKGIDLIALKIIKKAEEHDVVLVENPPLARSLFDNVPIEGEIPEEFYGAVAEVLAYVYSTGKKDMPVVDEELKKNKQKKQNKRTEKKDGWATDTPPQS